MRWRSRDELNRRLRQAGFDQADVDRALADLEAVGLVDDDRFAREVVRDQSSRRLAGGRAIRAALREKGVAGPVADRALDALAEQGTEEERAGHLAESRVGRLTGLTPEAAYRRLFGLLTRRGYGYAVARDASRAAVARAFPQADLS